MCPRSARSHQTRTTCCRRSPRPRSTATTGRTASRSAVSSPTRVPAVTTCRDQGAFAPEEGCVYGGCQAAWGLWEWFVGGSPARQQQGDRVTAPVPDPTILCHYLTPVGRDLLDRTSARPSIRRSWYPSTPVLRPPRSSWLPLLATCAAPYAPLHARDRQRQPTAHCPPPTSPPRDPSL